MRKLIYLINTFYEYKLSNDIKIKKIDQKNHLGVLCILTVAWQFLTHIFK